MFRLLLSGIAVCVLVVAGGETRQNPESCFLYQVVKNNASLEYDLRENQPNYLTINHISNQYTFTQVLDEEENCIVGLHYKEQTDNSSCQINFSSEEEYTTLVFQHEYNEVIVYQRGSMESEVFQKNNLQSIRAKSTRQVNVAYDCPGNCYQFKNGCIRKPYPVEMNSKKDPLIIYGMVENKTEPIEAAIYVRLTKQEWRNVTFVSSLEQAEEGKWFPYEFDALFKKYTQRETKYTMNLVVTDIEANETNPFDTAVGVADANLHLKFNKTSNVRWAVFCKPRIQRPLGPFSLFLEEKEISAVLVVCLVLLLVIGQWIYMCRQKWRMKTVTPRIGPVPLRPLPSLPGPLPNAAEVHEEDVTGHEYEYIDMEALQRQLEIQRSASRINVSCNEDPLKEKTIRKRASHASIN